MEKVNIDLDREKRCGIPEVVFAEFKDVEDIIECVEKLVENCEKAIVTRLSQEKANEVVKALKMREATRGCKINYNPTSKVLIVKKKHIAAKKKFGRVGLITAGTSDVRVAEEIYDILSEFGCEVIKECDCGVAGIHRVLKALERIGKVDVYIVVAGMEGTLPGVVSGLVKEVVIGVPTSVGYGTGKGGKAALNTMLNSCSPVAVVNIDNGYAAAILAYKLISSKYESR
ncbi:MAG TPA: nickel pincer cofactor biosynthesis protein LarB [Candidatus Altiarchaeales archaeon]|nr:nickel pincer cofactor biosynthesis protein LarB [Candidatus Altiarchaeales archaeon]